MRHHHHVDHDDSPREHYHHDHPDDVDGGGHDHDRHPPFYDDECCRDFFDVGTVHHDLNADHVHFKTLVNVHQPDNDDGGPRFRGHDNY